MDINLFDEFKWRGLIYEATPGLEEVLNRQKVVGYIGFDPSANSLHIGSLLPAMALARLQRCGHKPIAIVGGGTGMIGDPSGKSDERVLLTPEQVEINSVGIKAQLSNFLDFDNGNNAAIMINNSEWLSSISMIDFLRNIGKHFTVNLMISKESVKRRIESKEGISYTEFSYMLLQAYDFLELYDRYDCILQMGGSDQWGNIVAGIDLIRRIKGGKAYGLVSPLITTSSGTKFGKTEAGTVWLDPERTSPYHFYQYWLNTDDRDVITYLKFFTWLAEREITEIEKAQLEAPEAREAQKKLAEEITRVTHGSPALAQAVRISELFFSGKVEELKAEDILQVVSDAPFSEVQKKDLAADGLELAGLLADAKLATSKSNARRLVQSGGIYINNKRISDQAYMVKTADAIEGKIILLRKGKKQYFVVKVIG